MTTEKVTKNGFPDGNAVPKMAEISSKDEIWQLAGPGQLQHSAQGCCHAPQRCRDVIGHPRHCVEPGKQPGLQSSEKCESA